MSLFRHALINSDKKKFLKTIRYELISTPRLFGKTKDKHILYLARSLKTRQSFPVHLGEIKGFLIAIQHWEILMTDLVKIYCPLLSYRYKNGDTLISNASP